MKKEDKKNKVSKKEKNPGPKNKKNSHPLILMSRTFGQKASDFLTNAAGSWTFITILFILIAAWVYLNITAYVQHWDPWPFILLNLFLSCLAAVQAPIILMSQRRSGEKDRQRADYDYSINRKAEREIKEMNQQLNRIEKHMMMRREKEGQ